MLLSTNLLSLLQNLATDLSFLYVKEKVITIQNQWSVPFPLHHIVLHTPDQVAPRTTGCHGEMSFWGQTKNCIYYINLQELTASGRLGSSDLLSDQVLFEAEMATCIPYGKMYFPLLLPTSSSSSGGRAGIYILFCSKNAGESFSCKSWSVSRVNTDISSSKFSEIGTENAQVFVHRPLFSARSEDGR